MLEFPAFVLCPFSLVSLGIEYFAIVELLCLDGGKIALNLHLPLTENVGLSEMLDKVVDAVVSIDGLSDHLASQVSHPVGILGEILRKSRLMASRWHQVNVLASLLQVEKWQLTFPWGKLLVVPSLEVLGDRNDMFCYFFSHLVLFIPSEFLGSGICIPENLLNLVRSRVVRGDDHNSPGINVALAG